MGRIIADSRARIAAGATVVVADRPGLLHFLQASNSSATPGTVTLYDNTSATGTRLLVIHVASPAPYKEHFGIPLRFAIGLTVVCSASVDCHVVVEVDGRYT